MDPRAIKLAKVRLERARKAAAELERLRYVFEFDAIETAWAQFLVASNSLYEKLKAGRKTSASSREWWAKKAEERNTDPLLLYMEKGTKY